MSSGSGALRIQTEGGTHFEPGTRLRGRVAWKLDRPLEKLELRLLWRTSGEAIPDEQSVLRLDWGAGEARGEHPFELDLPAEAFSLRGKFFALDWILQAHAVGTDERAEREISLGPRGRALQRPSDEALAEPTPLPRVDADETEVLSGLVHSMRTNPREGARFVLLLALLAFGWNVAWACIAFGLGPISEPAPLWIWVILFPAGLVGVLFAMMFVSGLLVLIGPRPSLRLRSDQLVAGSEVPIGWTVAPGRRGSRAWRITLEAREEVDTRLDGTRGRGERAWYRGLVADYPSLERSVEGAAVVRLPRDLVPSFESRGLVIRWVIRFAAAAPRRSWSELPWMDKEFEVELRAPSAAPDPKELKSS